MLEPILVIAFIPGIVWPALDAVAMLPVFFPVTSILGPVHMLVGAYTLRLVIEPLALVAVAIAVDEPSLAKEPIVFPRPAVFASIFPELDSDTLAFTVLIPLAVVDSSVA